MVDNTDAGTVQPTEEEIIAALEYHGYGPEHCSAVRSKPDIWETEWEYAMLLAKLRTAIDGLRKIAKRDVGREWTATKENPETHWESVRGQFGRMATATLVEIGAKDA